jgi:hypothetical protein
MFSTPVPHLSYTSDIQENIHNYVGVQLQQPAQRRIYGELRTSFRAFRTPKECPTHWEARRELRKKVGKATMTGPEEITYNETGN